MNNELKLFRFNFYNGRAGTVEGLLLTTQDEINEASGREIYFGEILGKHSEVYGPLDPADFEEIPVSLNWTYETLSILGRTLSGYNPFDYLAEEEECG